MKKLSYLLSLFVIFLIASPLQATVLVKMDIPELSNVADAIVVGKVVQQNVEESARGRFYTVSSIKVIETLKGTPAQEIRIRQLGGEKNGIGMLVAGTETLKEGQEVLLFLKSVNNEYVLRGMGQGAFEITRENGSATARQMIGTVTGVSHQESADEPAKTQLIKPISKSLEDLIADIQANLKKGEKHE